MPIYPWSRNSIQRKILNSGRNLPDHNLDPPEDLDIIKKDDYDDVKEPEDWEEICQMLGLHS